MTTGVRLAAGGVGAVWAYSFLIETRWFEVTRRTIPLRGLPASLDGLRIVQVTDIHHGPTLSLDYVRRVVDATNALDPDLILLTGDYVYRSPVYIEPVVAELSRLRGRGGVIGVLGNHDWWHDAARTRRAFADIKVPLIDNDRLFLTPDRTLVRRPPAAGEGLCVAGVGDYMEDVIRCDDALGGVPDAMPRLLLSHNPDVAEDTRLKDHRVDLMLCGHTHGGQCWVPGIGTPITASRFGSKYARGLVNGPFCDVFTSRGIGTTVLPLRFAIRPEISVIEFRRA
jgi:predicted MPP superfamily phosphohydrolase